MKTNLFTIILIFSFTFGLSQRSENDNKNLIIQMMKVPNVVDSNQDSTLSSEEVIAASEQLATLDINGDGELDWKEMGAWEKELPLVRSHNITNLIDINGDVHISALEIESASHSLKQLDLNKDWVISKKELFFNKNPKAPTFAFSNKRMMSDEVWKKFRGYTTKNDGPILPGQNDRQYDGYALIHESADANGIQNSNETYLIDNLGDRVHTWKHNGNSPEGSVAYLLENGQLLRTYSKYGWVYDKQFPVSATTTIELVDWDGTVLWDITNSIPWKYSFHHDVEYLPNGNILAIGYNAFTPEAASALGWDISNGKNKAFSIKNNVDKNGVIWMCNVVELKPNIEDGSTEIVWQWNSWDHLVQDIFPDKPNYGDITDPSKINLNYINYDKGVLGNVGQFHHLNAVDYHQELDLILLGCPTYGEFWVIDHSTSTAEAANGQGGKHNKGGDILYRWGNPHATGDGTLDDKNLYWQHDVQWINEGLTGAGNVMIYNNGGRRKLDGTYNPEFKLLNFGQSYTEILEVKLPISSTGEFNTNKNAEVAWSWTAKNKEEYFSPFMSGASRLPNGNTIFCRGYDKYLIEVTPEGEKVMEYSIAGWGRLYRIYKYGAHYPGLKFPE